MRKLRRWMTIPFIPRREPRRRTFFYPIDYVKYREFTESSFFSTSMPIFK